MALKVPLVAKMEAKWSWFAWLPNKSRNFATVLPQIQVILSWKKKTLPPYWVALSASKSVWMTTDNSRELEEYSSKHQLEWRSWKLESTGFVTCSRKIAVRLPWARSTAQTLDKTWKAMPLMKQRNNTKHSDRWPKKEYHYMYFYISLWHT